MFLKVLECGLKLIVVINKVDCFDVCFSEVFDEMFELIFDLGGDEVFEDLIYLFFLFKEGFVMFDYEVRIDLMLLFLEMIVDKILGFVVVSGEVF